MTTTFESVSYDDHEQVVFVADPTANLRAIIAVHSTRLGPAAGGCRLWRYKEASAAQEDALRLSSGMTLKSAMAGLPLGGGKAVVLAPEPGFDRKALFEAFGEAVERLGGRYYTAEDVGVSPDDLAVAATRSSYVAGLKTGPYASGDPSPVTARGVFECLQVGAERVFGTKDLSQRKIAIQGLGHVGWHLAVLLASAGARLIVSDINKTRQELAIEELHADVGAGGDFIATEADILVPCALGGILTSDAVTRIRAKLVCGAANNQLNTIRAADAMHERGILYLPDYIVNGGGIINVSREILKIEDPSWAEDKVSELSVTIAEVLERAAKSGISPARIADQIARERVARGG